MLTPIDIQNKEFKHAFRGYNENDVNDFLDQIINDFEKLIRENDQLKMELAQVKKDNERYQQTEKNIAESLRLAQETAEKVTTQANKSADQMRENVIMECQNMRYEAELEAKKRIDEASEKLKTVIADYDRIVRSERNFLHKVKATMESELAVINDTMNNLPDPESEKIPAKNIESVKVAKAIVSDQTEKTENAAKKVDKLNKQEEADS